MAFFRKIKAGLVKSDIEEYVGEEGQLFFNIESGEFRLGDDVTVGGLPIFTFLNLADAPNSYLGAAGKFLAVNATEDSLEFVDAASGSSFKLVGSVDTAADLPQLYAGDNGDALITIDDTHLHVWSGTQWVDIGAAQTPISGFTGSQGIIGYTGSQGDIGYTGSAGINGAVGFTGSAGIDGAAGYTGSSGDVGFTGSAGTNGYTGSAGLSAYEIAAVNGFSGTEQEWLDSLGESLTAEPNAGLEITSSTITTVYNTLISDDVQSIAVGGAVAQPASAWKSKNIVEVLDTILFPDVAPTYTIPTISISGTQSGIKEIGLTVSQSLVLTTVKNDAGVFTALAITKGGTSIASSSNPTGSSAPNIAEQFGYSNPNNPNYSYSLSASESVTVINGSISWSGSGTYGAGLPKQNNKGVTDTRTAAVRSTSAPQSASSISASTITVTGIYPYFWGKSSTQPSASSIAAAILAGTANRVLSAANGTVTVTYGAVGEYIWLAHVASYTTKTKWYNTELNQGNIGAGNFILAPVTQAVNSPDAYWSNINFSIYISDGATVTDGAIQFRNS